MKKRWLAILLTLALAIGVIAFATPGVSAAEGITLLYDDRKDLSELLGVTPTTVEITNQEVTSYAVGTTDRDTNVLIYENGVLYAVGTGTATLNVNGTAYKVTVQAAPLSMFLIVGHSVGYGQEGAASQSVAVEPGQAYSSWFRDSISSADGGLGYGAASRVGGTGEKALDAFAAGQNGVRGVGSALAYRWNRLTGEKAWVINLAIPGSCVNEWRPGVHGWHTKEEYSYKYESVLTTFGYAQQIMKNEIAAGHYTLSHMSMVFFTGTNFTNAGYTDWTYASLKDDYDTIWNGLKKDLALDMDGDGDTETLESMSFVPFWAVTNNDYRTDKAVLYTMAASSEYPDVFIASDVYRDWLTEDGIASFPAIDYQTQKTAVSMPESVLHSSNGGSSANSIFCKSDNAHLSQVTYNAVGMDIAENVYRWYEKDNAVSSVELQYIKGNAVPESIVLDHGERSAVMVPAMEPANGASLTYSVSDNLQIDWPFCVRGLAAGTGTVKVYADGKEVESLTVEVLDQHVHCACGGHANGKKNHTCADVEYTPWGTTDAEKTSLPTTTGNYYLVSDITISETVTMPAGSNINLCLNGYDVTGSVRVCSVKGVTSVTDCAAAEYWGTISATTQSTNGGITYVYDNATLNIYGGNWDASKTRMRQGGIAIIGNSAPATLNVYAGYLVGGPLEIKSDSSETRGGTFYLIKNSVMNMYGGTITGGSSVTNGGSVYVLSGTKLNMYGGTISGGSAVKGGNVFVDGTMTMSGGTITSGTASGNGGNIATLSGSITMSGGTITSGVSTGGHGGNIDLDASTFKMTGGTVTAGSASGTTSKQGGNINLNSGSTCEVSAGTVSAGVAGGFGGNICGTPGAKIQISGSAKITDGKVGDGTTGKGGNLYAGASATSNATITISGGTVSGGQALEGGNILVDGECVISGGTIKDGVTPKADSKALGGNIATSTRATGGILTISGGTISGGVSYNGGSIGSRNNTTILGGTISGGQAANCGGNIYQINDKDRTLTISGGTIQNGKTITTNTTNFGGNIYIHGDNDKEVGHMEISGGTISGGIANCGGNIYLNGTLTMSDGLITGGSVKGSNSCGGNMYVGMKRNTSTGEIYPAVTMSGGTIENGKASSTGGNLQVHGSFVMTGGILSGGSAASGGNVRLFRPGQFVLDGGTITGGTATKHGGVFQIIGHTATTSYAQVGTLTVKSGSISGGSAVNGGTISVEHFGILNVEGGTITGGTAGGTYSGAKESGFGGTVYITNAYADRPNEVNISGGVIINGTAESFGEGIYVSTQEGMSVPTVTIRSDAQLDGVGANLYVNNTVQTNVVFEALSGKDTLFVVDAADKTAAFATADADYKAYLICDDSDYDVAYTDGKLLLQKSATAKVIAVYQGENEIACYATLEEAVIAAGSTGYVKLLANVESDYTITGTVWLDLNGFDLSGISVSGTLYGMDSSTDQYSDDHAGVLKATLIGDGKIASHCKTTVDVYGSIRRYLAIPDGDTYTFHRFFLGVQAISVKPSTIGVGYRAVFAGDDAVKAYLDTTDAYGYHIWLNGGRVITKSFTAERFQSLDDVTLRIDHFLDPVADDATNASRADMKVNANVFVKLSTGELIETDAVSYSFKDMVELAAAKYESFNAGQKAGLDSLGEQFNDLFFAWAVPFIHHNDESWTSWTDSGKVPIETGKYYLTTDITVTETLKIAPDQDVTLCLNGHTITGAKRFYYVSGTLSICDCCHKLDEEDQGYMIGKSTGLAPVLYTYYGGTVNLYSGNLTATQTVTQAGVLALGNDAGKFENENPHASVLNMYGGKIYGGTVSGNGGNIISYHGGTINMYGGEIFGGQAGGVGGNLYIASSVDDTDELILNLYGGTIRDGKAGTYGGNIYVGVNASVNIYDDAVVADGTALKNGGNIYVTENRALTMDGGNLIGGKAENGGSVFAVWGSGTVLNMSNGVISGGEANVDGGNLYIENDGTYVLKNMLITNGVAGNDGGNIYLFTDMDRANTTEEEVDILIDSCIITGGYAEELGGGIYAMEVDLTISGNTQILNNNGSDLCLGTGETVDLVDLGKDAKIGLSMNTFGTFSDDTAYASYIFSNDDSMTIEIVDGALKLVDASAMAKVPALTGFSVGWYRGVITPTEPVPMDGMGNGPGRMENWDIKTELEAGVTVIADETGIENAIVLVSVDTLFIQKELSDNLVWAISDATGISPNRIFFSASHTHSGVDHDAVYQPTRDYLDRFYVSVTNYVVKAVEDLAPASIETASVDVFSQDGFSLNASRRYIGDDGNAYSSVDGDQPSGAARESDADPELQIIRLVREGDKTDVILTNYQTHPVGWHSKTNGYISAENWMAFRKTVEAKMDNTVCTFFLGASGNVGLTTTAIRTNFLSIDGNIYHSYVSGDTAATIQGTGDVLASYVITTLNDPEKVNQVQPGQLQVANYTFETQDLYKSAQQKYSEIDLNINAISISSDVAFITAPYEMFHENGSQIKAYAQSIGIDTCFILTNSMGENKYIGSNNSFDNDTTDGKLTSFGVRTCRYIQGTAELLVEQYADMLAGLQGVEARNTIFASYTVKVVDTNGNPVQNVMVQLEGGNNTRNCSNADGKVVYYVYDGIDYAVSVYKLPEGYQLTGEQTMFTFDENRTLTIVVEAQA